MRLHFAGYTLDEGRRQLLEGESVVHLSPKAYELLTVLVESRPRALSKAQLHERIWPGTFVSDVNLAALVAELRAALGEHGRSGPCIRTLHGFGYAFAFADVRVEDGAPRAPEPGGAPDGSPGTSSVRRTCWLSSRDRDLTLAPGAQTIGRGREADVRIDALSISRRHALVRWTGTEASIEDLGSKNGTWVNGSKIAGISRLGDGDEVRLGSVRFTFRNLEAPGSTVTGTRV